MDFLHLVYQLDMKIVPKREIFKMFSALENKWVRVGPPKKATLKN